MQPDSVKLAQVDRQLTAALPEYPEAQDTPRQLATETCPEHPLPLYAYPVGRVPGREHVTSVFKAAKEREKNPTRRCVKEHTHTVR